MDNEQYGHAQKFPERLNEVVEISGLARLLFTTLCRCPFVPTVYKMFLFAVCQDERDPIPIQSPGAASVRKAAQPPKGLSSSCLFQPSSQIDFHAKKLNSFY